jgi:hypothetical protein
MIYFSSGGGGDESKAGEGGRDEKGLAVAGRDIGARVRTLLDIVVPSFSLRLTKWGEGRGERENGGFNSTS